MDQEKKKDVLLPTDAEAVQWARSILRTARQGALATLDPADSWPIATRVGVSTDISGAPVLLISKLASHTPALLAEPRCALMLGEPGKGDALAHARLMLSCVAREVERDSDEHMLLAARHVAHNPKSKLYVGLGDFRFFRLEPAKGSLNGGFGKAYALTAADILVESPFNAELAGMEQGAVEHMNDDHWEAVSLYARHRANAPEGRWTLLGLDVEGMTIAAGDDVRRVAFPRPLDGPGQLRAMLVEMAGEARRALGQTA